MASSETTSIGDYQLGSELGSGAFGTVYKATKNGYDFAIKKIDVDDDNAEKIMKEVESHSILSHENVVNYYNFYIDNAVWIVMELCNGGNLNSYLLNNFPWYSYTTYRTLLDFIKQVCRGVDYLHSQNVIHRDIKPDNIMICTRFWGLGWEYTLKLTDFGLARVWENFNYKSPYYPFSYDPRGPRYYSAPEFADGNITIKSDIFSLGCLVLAIFARTAIPWNAGKLLLAPYIGNPPVQIADATEEQKSLYVQEFVQLPCGGDERKLQQLVFSMVQEKWRDRPSARTVLSLVNDIGAGCTIL